MGKRSLVDLWLNGGKEASVQFETRSETVCLTPINAEDVFGNSVLDKNLLTEISGVSRLFLFVFFQIFKFQ